MNDEIKNIIDIVKPTHDLSCTCESTECAYCDHDVDAMIEQAVVATIARIRSLLPKQKSGSEKDENVEWYEGHNYAVHIASEILNMITDPPDDNFAPTTSQQSDAPDE